MGDKGVILFYFMGRLSKEKKCGSRFQAEFSGCDFLIEEFKELT